MSSRMPGTRKVWRIIASGCAAGSVQPGVRADAEACAAGGAGHPGLCARRGPARSLPPGALEAPHAAVPRFGVPSADTSEGVVADRWLACLQHSHRQHGPTTDTKLYSGPAMSRTSDLSAEDRPCCVNHSISSLWQVSREDIQSRLDLVKGGALRAGLEGGVAFLHDSMALEDRKIAEDLFAVGAVQVALGTGSTEAKTKCRIDLLHEDSTARAVSVRCWEEVTRNCWHNCDALAFALDRGEAAGQVGTCIADNSRCSAWPACR